MRPAIPKTVHIFTSNNLAQSPGLEAADFDKARREDEDVGQVKRNTCCRTFPFNYVMVREWISMSIHIEPEVYGCVMSGNNEGMNEGK
jgi:hypothetical protein